jgi:hypothetical protein
LCPLEGELNQCEVEKVEIGQLKQQILDLKMALAEKEKVIREERRV